MLPFESHWTNSFSFSMEAFPCKSEDFVSEMKKKKNTSCSYWFLSNIWLFNFHYNFVLGPFKKESLLPSIERTKKQSLFIPSYCSTSLGPQTHLLRCKSVAMWVLKKKVLHLFFQAPNKLLIYLKSQCFTWFCFKKLGAFCNAKDSIIARNL